MKRTVQPRTVAPYKKAGDRDSLKISLLAQLLAREAVRQAVFDLTGIWLVDRLRTDGKIGLEIPREPVA